MKINRAKGLVKGLYTTNIRSALIIGVDLIVFSLLLFDLRFSFI
jgi:hypothetical protein